MAEACRAVRGITAMHRLVGSCIGLGIPEPAMAESFLAARGMKAMHELGLELAMGELCCLWHKSDA